MPLRSAAAVVALLLASGCQALPTPVAQPIPVVPSLGVLFEQYKAPIQTRMAGGMTLGTKMGVVRVRSIRDPIFTGQPLVTWGDTPQDIAIQQAAKNGGIRTIRHVDYERFSVLSIFLELKIVVYGD